MTNYSYADTYDGADCDDPNVGSTSCIDESMVRVPRHSFITDFIFKNNRNFENKLSINYSSEVRDYGNGNNSFKDVILDEFMVVDYTGVYNLYDKTNLFFNVNNIFNNNYEKAFMYSSMDRTVNVGFKSIF